MNNRLTILTITGSDGTRLHQYFLEICKER